VSEETAKLDGIITLAAAPQLLAQARGALFDRIEGDILREEQPDGVRPCMYKTRSSKKSYRALQFHPGFPKYGSLALSRLSSSALLNLREACYGLSFIHEGRNSRYRTDNSARCSSLCDIGHHIPPLCKWTSYLAPLCYASRRTMISA
jgi:hypothetical protein